MLSYTTETLRRVGILVLQRLNFESEPCRTEARIASRRASAPLATSPCRRPCCSSPAAYTLRTHAQVASRRKHAKQDTAPHGCRRAAEAHALPCTVRGTPFCTLNTRPAHATPSTRRQRTAASRHSPGRLQIVRLTSGGRLQRRNEFRELNFGKRGVDVVLGHRLPAGRLAVRVGGGGQVQDEHLGALRQCQQRVLHCMEHESLRNSAQV